MVTEKIGHRIVKYYDGELVHIPYHRMVAFDKAILIDSTLGSDLNAVNKYDNLILSYIEKGDKKLARQACENRRIILHNIISNVSPEYDAFCALVHSLDGKQVSPSEAKEILSTQVTRSIIQRVIYNVKKNLKQNVESFLARSRREN